MIDTPRLIIRRFTPDDWRDLYEYLSLEQIYTFEPGEPINEKEAKDIANERANTNNFYAVVLKDTMKMIGHLYFQQINPERFLTWEIGYIFNPAYYNNEYCTEASQYLIDYAFKELKAHRIIGFCNEKNIPSWRVLEKIGLRREGHFIKKAYFRKDEQGKPLWFNTYQYAILNDAE